MTGIIPPIVIDTQGLIEMFGRITPTQINQMLDNIAKGMAASFAQKLEQEASRSLRQTRMRYINNIRLIDSGKCQGTVLLDYSKDPLVQMLEEGASPFDMKDGLLKGPKSKVGADGRRYNTVPTRWGVPTTQGDSDVFGGIMPKGVYNAVKDKPTDIPVAGGGSRSKGLRLDEIPSSFQIPKTRAAIVDEKGNEMWKAYKNKSAMHEGMVKKTDAVTGQNQYATFRRVAESGVSPTGKKLGSDPDAFIHPGIEQYNFIQKTLAGFNIPNEVGSQLDNELAKLGFI